MKAGIYKAVLCLLVVGFAIHFAIMANKIYDAERDITALTEITKALGENDKLLNSSWRDAIFKSNERNYRFIEDYYKHLLMKLNAQMKLTRNTRDSIADVNDFLQARISNSNSNLSSFRARMGHRIDGLQDRMRKEFDNLPANLIPVLARELTPSVVKINVNLGLDEYTGREISWTGSGVFIERDLILTAGHVVDIDGSFNSYHNVSDEYMYKVGPRIEVELVDGTILEVVDYYMEAPEITDVGLVRVKVPEFTTLETRLAGSTRPKPLSFGYAVVGETLMAIGEPFGYYPSVSSGIVSALDVEDDFFGEANLLQTDTPLNPGNSGCPVFNMKGEIVAICVGGITYSDGVGFCIPADVCKMVIEKYKIIRALEAVE